MGIWGTQNRSNDGGRKFSPRTRMEASYPWGLHHGVVRFFLGNNSAKLKLRISQQQTHRSLNSKNKTILNSGSLGKTVETGTEIMIKKQ